MQHRFDQHAQHWDLLGSPLRPCAEDMRLMQSCFDKWHDAYRSVQSPTLLKALLLGVTPEVASSRFSTAIAIWSISRIKPASCVATGGLIPYRFGFVSCIA